MYSAMQGKLLFLCSFCEMKCLVSFSIHSDHPFVLLMLFCDHTVPVLCFVFSTESHPKIGHIFCTVSFSRMNGFLLLRFVTYSFFIFTILIDILLNIVAPGVLAVLLFMQLSYVQWNIAAVWFCVSPRFSVKCRSDLDRPISTLFSLWCALYRCRGRTATGIFCFVV